MDILKRLFAALLGVTVLPLRVLAYNLLCAMSALFIGIAVIIAIPLIVATVFHKMGMPKLLNLSLNVLLIFPIVTALTALTLIAVGICIILETVFHMLHSAWLGLKNGFLHGMNGFWHTLARQNTLGEQTLLGVRARRAGVAVDELINDVDFDGFQRVVGELQDVIVVHEDLEVPDLQSKEPRAPIVLLEDSETQQMERLIKEIDASKEPLALQIKEKIAALKILFTQYKDLARKLEEVRSALVSKDKSTINDELIAFNEVETPILLVKQYKKENQWYNVPACSCVTDKESLLHWLKTNPRHPINKDLLKNPEPYHQMEAKYTWYELTEKDCSSQELGEAATQMRILAVELVAHLSDAQKMHLGVSLSSQSFFSLFPNTDSHSPSSSRRGDLQVSV